MINRRNFLRLAKTFGWSSTLLAATAMTGTVSVARLAQAAQAVQTKREKQKPRLRMTYVVPVLGDAPFRIGKFGPPEFVRDLEERTNGEIRVELITGMEICNQLECVKRAQQGIVELFMSGTQNSATAAPYYNVLDFPYLFPSRAAQNYFIYHPKSEKILREPLRKHHGIHFLFTSCRLRGLMMGKKWEKRADISRISELEGLTIRVTASQLGKLALQLLKTNAVPMPWNETANALQYGLIDGMESWESAVAAAMPQVISQVVDLRLFSGFGHTAMNAAVFDKLPPDLQAAVMESAYVTQMFCQLASEASLVNTVGASNPQKADTIFGRNKVRFVELSPAQLRQAEQLCAPKYNPAPWTQWRTKLDRMAGGIDTYQAIYDIAREIPVGTLAENVMPRRWWKAGEENGVPS